jgi:hypothetical protein
MGRVAAACTTNTQGSGAFSNVMALWHFDNNGIDNGAAGTHTLTLNGAGTYSAVQSKFGGFAYRGGSASSATGAVAPTSMTDFTFELWYLLTSLPGASVMISDNNATAVMMRYNGASGAVLESADGGGTIQNSSYALQATSTWIHLAWVRASNVHSFYVNGTSQALSGVNWTGAVGGTANLWTIGNVTTGGGGGYAWPTTGYIDEMRISNMARYTSNFTPATLPFCNI